jgi:Flp pilus assembly protein TadD
VALAALAAYFAFVRPQLLRSRAARDVQSHYTQPSSAAAAEVGDAWSQIQAYLDRGEYSTALSMARAMTNRAATDPFAYACLGRVYLAMGDITNAEALAVRAYELYPIDENEKALAAIRKRIARERDTQPVLK